MNNEQHSADTDLEIVHALEECLPDNWNAALLDVRQNQETEGVASYRFQIRGVQGKSPATASEELMAAVREHSMASERAGFKWGRIVITMSRVAGGPWDFYSEAYPITAAQAEVKLQ